MHKVEFDLIDDCLYYLMKNEPSVVGVLSQTSKNLQSIATKCIAESNQTIQKDTPTLLEDRDKTVLTKSTEFQLFKLLMQNLHMEAERLNCDQPYPEASSLDKVSWELIHHNNLIAAVQQQTEAAKTNAFYTFVQAVAEQCGIPIPQGTDLKAFWHDILKNDPRIPQMQSLTLLEKNMKFLPKEISCLSGLEEIYLSDNQLKELPPEFASLSELKIVDLSFNYLTKIPSQLASLPLEHLRLQNNKIKKISPSDIEFLAKLQYVDLSYNNLERIPQETSKDSKIQYLYLNNANQEELSNGLTKLESLKELYFSGNQVKDISKEELSLLSEMRKVHLYNNPLTEDSVEKLKQLESIKPIIIKYFDEPQKNDFIPLDFSDL